MKRVFCLLMGLLMLLSSTAMAAAPQIEAELPIEVDYETSREWMHIKYNGSAYKWTSVWVENDEYMYDNSGEENEDVDLYHHFYSYTNLTEWHHENPGKTKPCLIFVSGEDFDVIKFDFFRTYYDEDDRQYVRLTADGGTPLSELVELIVDEDGNIVVREKDYMHNNIRSFGPRFSDVYSDLTNEWYRFTALDLSEDGKQCYYMISGDHYIVGQVEITVNGDAVKVDYKYYSEEIWDWKDYRYFTIFNDLESVTSVEPDAIEKKMEYGVEYSIANDLGGDTDVLLYMCNKATHTSNQSALWIFRDQYAPFVKQINAMIEMSGTVEPAAEQESATVAVKAEEPAAEKEANP